MAGINPLAIAYAHARVTAREAGMRPQSRYSRTTEYVAPCSRTPYAGPLPSIHDPGYRLLALIECLTGLYPLPLPRTHVLRGQPFQYL